MELEVVNAPANGEYYVAGEDIQFRYILTDGAGNPLDEEGQLPTFSEFIFGGTGSGLRYFDLFLNPTLYYALKHREGNVTLAMAGPTDRLKVTDYTVPFTDFFNEQIRGAFAQEHGFSAVTASLPSYPVLLGGLVIDPTIWNAPVSNIVTLTVPDDALPGTYVVASKARRDFMGEAINTGTFINIQVGTSTMTQRQESTSGCSSCHSGRSTLQNNLHGIEDPSRISCFAGCHTALEVEPDASLDYRVHFIHTRSNRYPADADDCLACHNEQPESDPRGYPGFVFPYPN
jgi:hypothetical protein